MNSNNSIHQKTTGLYIAIFLVSSFLHGQDSTNIIDYSDKFLLRIYTNTKTNAAFIKNKENNTELKLLPNGSTSLGVGFNYNGFGLSVAFSLPKSSGSKEKFGKTESLDFRGSLYGRKIGGDAFFQLYKGYYNSNPNDFINWTNNFFPQIGDMQVLSVGVTGFYIFNSERYSYRAAFVRDEVQKNSAGSFLLGMFGYFDEAKTDNGFVPAEFPDEFREVINIKEFKNLAIGISAGYAYNYIINDHWTIGATLLPGFGFQRVEVKDLNGSSGDKNQAAAQLLTSLALGYEHKHFFMGLTGSVNFRQIDFGPYDFSLSTQQFRVTLGKRFNLKKKNALD